MENQFWVAANILFNIDNGATSNVMLLVNRPDDATEFKTFEEASTYLSFIQSRATHIRWSIEAPTPQRPFGYRIRGVQAVER